MRRAALIVGSGISAELIPSVLEIVEAAGVEIDWLRVDVPLLDPDDMKAPLEEAIAAVESCGVIGVIDSIKRDDGGRVRFHYNLVDRAAEWRWGEAVAASDVPAVKWVKFADIDNHGIRDITVRVIRQAAEMRRR